VSDFTKPVNPQIDWNGKSYSEIVALYDGSGGGTGVDISSTGLEWIQYVMVYQDESDTWSAEIDAFADVSAVYPCAEEIARQRLENAILRKTEAVETIDLAIAEERECLEALSKLPDCGTAESMEVIKMKIKVQTAMVQEAVIARKALIKSIDMLGEALALLDGEGLDERTYRSEFKLRKSDINGDGIVNSLDLSILSDNWMKGY
jgi:hypothetical protein